MGSSGLKLAPIQWPWRKLSSRVSALYEKFSDLQKRARLRVSLWLVAAVVVLLPKRKGQDVLLFRGRTGKPPSPLDAQKRIVLPRAAHCAQSARRFRFQVTIFFE
jgi:hypothetical protein